MELGATDLEAARISLGEEATEWLGASSNDYEVAVYSSSDSETDETNNFEMEVTITVSKNENIIILNKMNKHFIMGDNQSIRTLSLWARDFKLVGFNQATGLVSPLIAKFV